MQLHNIAIHAAEADADAAEAVVVQSTHGAELPQTEQNFLAALVLDGSAAAARYSCADVGAPAGALGSGTSACSRAASGQS